MRGEQLFSFAHAHNEKPCPVTIDKTPRYEGVQAEIENDKWISIDEAAEYLGVKPGTIRDWIRKGKDIPAHKIGKQWKFKCSELDDWVSSGKSAMD